MDQNIRIAVIGGTGKAGKYLIKELLSQGFRIRALMRNPEKLELHPLLEKVKGDVRDYESIYNLINGCDVVISTLGQRKGEEPVFSVSAKNIIKAMSALQVKRYIVLTGLTLDISSDRKRIANKMRSQTMKLFFGKIIHDKEKEYKIIEESSLDWTVVRVPFIGLSDERKDVKSSLTDCDGRIISSASLALFLIDQIEDRNYIRKAPFIWDKE
ncbi:MAG TPA: NAD(P)H-binding protein [Bacteroidales bacterium]|nr:NAD(P)H-binding protein [Bacteroidales bacterium]